MNKVFAEVLSRTPDPWEILIYGDRWLRIEQAKAEKDINDLIKENLMKTDEYINKSKNKKKFDTLIDTEQETK